MQLLYPRRPALYLAAFAFCVATLFLALSTARTSASGARNNSKQKLQARQAAMQREIAWQTRLREIDEKLRNPRLLLLRTAEFDPLAGELAPVRIGQTQLETTSLSARNARFAARAGQQATNEARYFIVQYADRITPQRTASLRDAGYEITGYLANNAYIVKAPRNRENQLLASRSRGEFRWVGAYGSGLKIESDLSRIADGLASSSMTRADLDNADHVAISFLTFHGENSAATRQVLGQLNLATEPIIEERNDGRTWGLITVTPEQLPQVVTALASVEGIEWIERRRPHHLRNDIGVRVVQSGIVGTDTPLYRHGLTGAGQIYGTADSGLDDDHAQFRLDGQVSSQTLSFAISTSLFSNTPLPISITNPNNKVLVYYLLGVGSLIDEPANPNGGKTLKPDEKNTFGDYINAVAYDDSDGIYHGTATTSCAVGRDFNASGTGALPGIATRTSGDGVAPDARIVFQDVGHPSGQLPGVDFISQARIHQQAYDSGVRVHNNSYGPPPPVSYDQDAADVDDVMWRLRDYNIFFSAGNDGPVGSTIELAAKNHISVAATESPTLGGNIENLADFSSHGPTSDGRIKPDIAAPGEVRAATENSGIASSFGASTSRTAQDAAVNPASPNNNRSLALTAGTSFSSPMAAGGALLVRQYFADGYYPSGARNAPDSFNPSNALVKAIMLNSGRNMTGNYTASDGTNGARGLLPNFGQGWGRLALDDALYFAGDQRELKVLADVYNGATATDNTRPAPNAAIMTGQTHTYQINNVSTIEPLRITLVWSDPKASVGAQIALVNNLDLEVVDPQGAVYRGNVNFANTYSQPANGAAFDNRNPVEAVYIQFPQAGTYTVRVMGANVPGNGQMQILAQPGNQLIDSNRQGYALIATGNFTAGAQAVLNLSATSVTGGVNADPFISRNETVTATVTVADPVSIPANNVTAQVAVDAASQIPASLVRINGRPAGQAASLNYGNIASGSSKSLAFQITLLDDNVNRAGQAISFNVTMTSTNGPSNTVPFTIIAEQRLITYRTRFEPTPDPGGAGIVVIPEANWGLRPDNPQPAPNGDPFGGAWQLTTSKQASSGGSTASLGDPSGVGASYGVSSTVRGGGVFFDDARWWTTQKIVLPGLNVNAGTGRVSNPELAAQLNAAVDSFDVDINADFTGDINQPDLVGDVAILRVRPYSNNASVNSTDDSGFNSTTSTNLLYVDSSTSSTNGFKHFSGKSFAAGSGIFNVDTVSPNNSDVAFRLELQLRRNSVPQTGEGVFFDNLEVHFRVGDLNVYSAPLTAQTVSVNAASYAPLASPGAIMAAFGGSFPANTNLTAFAQTLPLPTQLSNVSVRVNGVLAPLFFVGVGGGFGAGGFQINYQLPYATQPGVAYVEVLNNDAPISSEFLTVNDAGPGIFTTTSNGQGQAVALNQDNSFNGDPNFINRKPEARGNIVVVYATGQGAQFIDPATSQPLTMASGVGAPFNQLYVTAMTPTITIGGVPAGVYFSGLAPGFAGLWQLNIIVPSNAPTGNTVPLVVKLGGQTSLTTTIAVN